ncbi:hypothetical protein LTR17_026386 [Elasticomyces elasticus]|nr:hypothetical protein LTR17_026386 [Elasticomyces elasticus]
MGCYDIFCTLCGAPLTKRDVLDSPDPEPGEMYWDYSSKLMSDADLEWLSGPLRMVAKREHWKDAPKSKCVDAQIYDSSGYNGDSGYFEVTDGHGEKHWSYAYELTAQEGFLTYHFIMHAECLTVLELALEAYSFCHEESALNRFYDALCTIMQVTGPSSSALILPHGYFGAAQFQEQDWEAEKGWEFLVAHPNDIPNATQYLISHLHSSSLKDQQSEQDIDQALRDQRAPSNRTKAPSRLESLPAELLRHIETQLPINSAFSLRLASRALAASLPLTQSFWQRRLVTGDLFGFSSINLDKQALEQVEKGKDWKRLVKALSKYESFNAKEGGRPNEQWGDLSDAPIGLRNHLRIWHIIMSLLRAQM